MAFIIAEPCIGVKDTACVSACPVDWIHPRRDEADFESTAMLYINPIEWIDCGACAPVCPVQAIYAEGDVPEPTMGTLRKDKCGYLCKIDGRIGAC
jgi:NAD-dependent dihydropyrimidine dehydrogenase PreA subunit